MPPTTKGEIRMTTLTNLRNDSSECYDRYLRLLGLEHEKPGIRALTRILRAHLRLIPFENVSKLYYWKKKKFAGIPGLESYLDGIERYHFGGTCYAINFHLHQLLRRLGYDADLCGAEMSKPDVHIVNIVRIWNREFIVDAGYSAPLIDPIPRDLRARTVLPFHGDIYVIHPKNAQGRSRLDLMRNGRPIHGYTVNPAPRRIEEFENVIRESYLPDATFMNSLLLSEFGPEWSRVIHNRTMTGRDGKKSRRLVPASIPEMITTIHETFGVPPDITTVALKGLSLDQGAWD